MQEIIPERRNKQWLKWYSVVLMLLSVILGRFHFTYVDLTQFLLICIALIFYALSLSHFKRASSVEPRIIDRWRSSIEITGVLLFVIGLSFILTPAIIFLFEYLEGFSRNRSVDSAAFLASLQTALPPLKRLTVSLLMILFGAIIFLIGKFHED